MIACGGKRLVTKSWTGMGTWVCPVTTNRLEVLYGKAGDGAPGGGTSSGNTGGAFTGLALGAGSGATGGQATWAMLKAYADTAFAAINGGATTITGYTFSQYNSPSQSYTLSNTGVVTLSGTPVAGSASFTYNGGAAASGPIVSNGNIVINFSIQNGGSPSTGNSCLAFGKTWAGGSGQPATPATYFNVPVTPGTSYDITAFSDCFIQIQYLE